MVVQGCPASTQANWEHWPSCLQLLHSIFLPFPIYLSISSFPETLPTPTAASPARAWLLLPYQLSFLFSSLVFSWLSLQLPADRVRQVRPVLRAPGPPSTSNQIPPIPRRPPSPSLPGQLLCDLTVAPPPRPQIIPFICDLVCRSGELTHPGVTLVKTCVPLWYCSRPVL